MASSPQSQLVQGYAQAVATASKEDQLRVGLVARLMTHYWQPEMTPHERKCQAIDWRNDLRAYPVDVVSAACDRYRGNTQNRERPLPAQISALCSEIINDRRERVPMLPAPRPSRSGFVFTDKELRQRAQWAEMKGYPAWDAFLNAVHARQESIFPFLAWAASDAPEPVEGFKAIGSVL